MAKISKRVLGEHLKAVKLLEKDELDFYEREFVFMNYHEGAGKMNNLISAHFTPYSIAGSMTFNVRQNNFVDLCAGIGILSYAMLRYNEYEWQNKEITGICIENCVEYYEVGKKLLPQFYWINGDIFDPAVISQVKELMKGKEFSIISNPPYGAQVKTVADYLKYNRRLFEYRAIEVGAIYGAYDGAFLIPQGSCPFRITKPERGETIHESYKTDEYKKFVELTGLEIFPNNGFHTDVPDDDENGGWRDVSIVTEIAIVEYNELEYIPKLKSEEKKVNSGPPPPPALPPYPPPPIDNQIKLFE